MRPVPTPRPARNLPDTAPSSCERCAAHGEVSSRHRRRRADHAADDGVEALPRRTWPIVHRSMQEDDASSKSGIKRILPGTMQAPRALNARNVSWPAVEPENGRAGHQADTPAEIAAGNHVAEEVIVSADQPGRDEYHDRKTEGPHSRAGVPQYRCSCGDDGRVPGREGRPAEPAVEEAEAVDVIVYPRRIVL